MVDIKYPRGSEWRKWDLHIHSPSTILNNEFEGADDSEKWNRYVEKLESLSNTAVLGVTDYFDISGYNKLDEFKRAGRLKNIAQRYGVSDAFVKTEENANLICKNLSDGKYNTSHNRFREVNWIEAERYASRGGFSIAAWRNPDGYSGHVAIVIGGYDGDVSARTLRIFHADGEKKFGKTFMSRGFRINQLKNVKYYIWEAL